MVNLLENYDLTAILIILIVLIGIIAGAITWIFNTYEKTKKIKVEVREKIIDEENFTNRMNKLEEDNAKQSEVLEKHGAILKTLVDSDRSRIKGEILKEYNRFRELGYIDAYSLEYLHQQYSVYKNEGGNSWVETIMDKIDDLPIKDF